MMGDDNMVLSLVRKLLITGVVLPVWVGLHSGCSSVPGTTDIGDITLNVGDSSTCLSNPCTVYFVMPPGKGKLTLREDGPSGVWETGKFEAGSKVRLGEYWAGQTVFSIDEQDAPKTWLTITGRR